MRSTRVAVRWVGVSQLPVDYAARDGLGGSEGVAPGQMEFSREAMEGAVVYRSASNLHLSLRSQFLPTPVAPKVAQLIMPYARFSVIMRSADR